MPTTSRHGPLLQPPPQRQQADERASRPLSEGGAPPSHQRYVGRGPLFRSDLKDPAQVQGESQKSTPARAPIRKSFCSFFKTKLFLSSKQTRRPEHEFMHELTKLQSGPAIYGEPGQGANCQHGNHADKQ
jgi:hypothetical protein